MQYILVLLLVIQITILIVFVIQSIKQRRLCNLRSSTSKPDLDSFDVIIAARENIEIIRNCLLNVLSVGFNNIILCIDGGSESVASCLMKEFPTVKILYNEKSLGKIKAQIGCLHLSTKRNVLILDADITLIKTKVESFVSYFIESNVDFLCPYSVGISTSMNSFLFAVAETDRHMRQRVVRAGRDAYGVSNLSGYCMLANREKYIDIIDTDAIQDDVIATINLLNKQYTVKTYHQPVCSEIERTSLKSYLLQKTRWTAGNIVLVKSYNKLFKATDLTKAFAFTSSFLLWYWSLWVDFVAFLSGFAYPVLFVFLIIEGVVKLIGLVSASKPQKRLTSIILYILLWPVFSTVCLALSPYYLTGRIVEQKTRR